MVKKQENIALSSALKVYGFLVLELVFLRLLFHFFLKVKIGWSYTTDFGLFIPVSFAFFTYWMVLARKSPPQLGLQTRIARIHLVFVGALVLFTSWFQETEGINGVAERTLWFCLLVGVIATGLTLFVRPRFYLKNENAWAIIPCALIGILVPLYQHHYELFWPLLGKRTGQSVCSLLPALGMPEAFCKINRSSQLIISLVPYRAILAPGCVGLEGQLLNSLTVLIFGLVHHASFKPFRLISYFFIGALGIYWINVFRILVLMKLGHWSMFATDTATAHFWIRFVFHSHAGWILYGGYLGFLYWSLPVFEAKLLSLFEKRPAPQSDPVSF